MKESDYQHAVITGQPLFPIGEVIATEDVATSVLEPDIIAMVQRHSTGDFGVLCQSDVDANHRCIESNRGQILSAYMIGDEKIYVITDHGRERTTVLWSYEY